MKKHLPLFVLICFGIVLFAGYLILRDPLNKEEKIALSNCIEYIKNTPYSTDFKENINTNYVLVENLPNEIKEAVWVDVEGTPNWEKDYWVFTIGDISGQYYAKIVCDKETKSVIGYIPIL